MVRNNTVWAAFMKTPAGDSRKDNHAWERDEDDSVCTKCGYILNKRDDDAPPCPGKPKKQNSPIRPNVESKDADQ